MVHLKKGVGSKNGGEGTPLLTKTFPKNKGEVRGRGTPHPQGDSPAPGGALPYLAYMGMCR